MGLKQSFYDGGRHSRDCEICGDRLPRIRGARFHKCHTCAQKIAKDVSEEFEANKGHYLTESILASSGPVSDAIIASEVVKTIEEKEDDKS